MLQNIAWDLGACSHVFDVAVAQNMSYLKPSSHGKGKWPSRIQEVYVYVPLP